jgi:hypothetical protein
MSISEHFRYRNDIFQSDIFVSDIGITDVDVRCRISPTLRSMSMPTYVENVALCGSLGGVCSQSYIYFGTFPTKLLLKSQLSLRMCRPLYCKGENSFFTVGMMTKRLQAGTVSKVLDC